MKKPTLTDYRVFYTDDLSIFKHSPANRDVNENRAKSISKSMALYGPFPMFPIVVNAWLTVIDGQHRFRAATLAGTGLFYMIDPKVGNSDDEIFEAAAIYNQDGQKWSKFDFLGGMAKRDIHSYKVLWGFMKKYPMFSLTESIMFLQNTGTKWLKKTDFTTGKFKIGSEMMAEAWAERILRLRPYFKQYNSSNFVRTMIILFEKKSNVFKFDEFLHKLELRPTALKPCGDKRSYSELIEEIYNYKRKNDEKVSIRFL